MGILSGNSTPTPVREVIVIDRPSDRDAPKEPKNYVVLLLNDDYTPFNLVVDILNQVFRLPANEAYAKMVEAHRSGRANIGYFPRELGETKINNAVTIAQAEGYPLNFSLEEA